jgi:phosphate uptake regulator
MARQTLENKNVRKITKSGGKSYSLTLPISFIRELGWQKKQKVVVEMDKKKKVLVIKDWE